MPRFIFILFSLFLGTSLHAQVHTGGGGTSSLHLGPYYLSYKMLLESAELQFPLCYGKNYKIETISDIIYYLTLEDFTRLKDNLDFKQCYLPSHTPRQCFLTPTIKSSIKYFINAPYAPDMIQKESNTTPEEALKVIETLKLIIQE